MRIAALVCLAGLVFAQPPSAFNPASLSAELRRMHMALASGRDAEVLAALPAAWQVQTRERPYAISTEPLRTLLAPDSPQRDLNRELAEGWLEQLAENLEGYSKGGRFPPEARARLDRILARPEFAGVREPGPWERFRDWLNARIQRILRDIFAIAARHRIASDFLFWLALAAAIGFVGVSLFRHWMGDPDWAAAAAVPPHSPKRSGTQWLRAALAAAAAGDLREAIHCAYWAGIAHLQDASVLPKDATFTPRERLRAVDVNATFFGPLSALTTALERFWYAGRVASADDFNESLRQLEKLGCHPG